MVGEAERHLPSIGSFSKWLQRLGGRSDQSQKPYLDGRGSNAWIFLCCFPRRELDCKWGSQDGNWSLYGDASAAGDSFTHYATTLAPIK